MLRGKVGAPPPADRNIDITVNEAHFTPSLSTLCAKSPKHCSVCEAIHPIQTRFVAATFWGQQSCRHVTGSNGEVITGHPGTTMRVQLA